MTKTEYQRQRRNETRDLTVERAGLQKQGRVKLGLALLRDVAIPGVEYDYSEIAAWCGCTDSAILAIEQRALRKLRHRFRFMRDPRLRDLMEQMFERRQAAQSQFRT